MLKGLFDLVNGLKRICCVIYSGLSVRFWGWQNTPNAWKPK